MIWQHTSVSLAIWQQSDQAVVVVNIFFTPPTAEPSCPGLPMPVFSQNITYRSSNKELTSFSNIPWEVSCFLALFLSIFYQGGHLWFPWQILCRIDSQESKTVNLLQLSSTNMAVVCLSLFLSKNLKIRSFFSSRLFFVHYSTWLISLQYISRRL